MAIPDIRDYLEIRTARPSNFSPDGTKVLVQSNLTGTAQLFVVGREGGDMRQLTTFDDSVAGAYLPTSDEVVLAMSAGGSERQQLSVIADEGADLRPLVHDPESIHRLGGASRDGALIAYASNARNGVDFDVYVIPATGGVGRMVFAPGGWCQPAGFSPDGRYLAVVRLSERSGDDDLYLADVVDGSSLHVSPHDGQASFGTPAWMADSSAFFFSTDEGRDRRGIARYSLADKRWSYVLEDERDLSCLIDWPGRRLVVTADQEGQDEVRILDPLSLSELTEVGLPGTGTVDVGFSRDGRYLAYSFTSAVEPGDAWIYDCERNASWRLTHSPRAIQAEEMTEPEVERVTSSDGESIAMFVYRGPSNSDQVPVVVYLHGGPESRHRASFDPLIQYLVAAGYAVVAPNVRGSTGYGKRFEHLDDGRRRLDVMQDLAAVHDWIENAPGLDGRRAAVLGASYGGYLVLAALAFQPERWAAGVDVVGISSLPTFLENTAPWRRRVREAEYGSLEHDRDFLERASPLNRSEAIRAPLLVVHGANDPRVPLSEAQQIHDRVRANGVRCELLVYPDEGHGLSKLSNRLDAYPRAIAFLDEVLGRG